MQDIKNSVQSNRLNLERQKEMYVATLAHDLKNPLNSQIVALEQLLKEKFGGITLLQKEIINDIISSSKFMREMLSSLLSVYKFENGVVKLNKTNTDINDILKTCLKDVTALADEHCVIIEYINNTINGNLVCDESYIRRVIANMLNNLVMYSYKNTKALVILEEDKLSMSLRFKSSGFPIDENLKNQIFEKYASGLNNRAGTGLGLYFCRKVVEAHGGIIGLESNKSDIEFTIKFPKIQSGSSLVKFV